MSIDEIRKEAPQDHEAIRSLTIEAFSGSEFGHNGEADLVELLREKHPESLSLVATSDDQIIGHIMFTPAAIQLSSDSTAGMGLAPMSVSPTHQHDGIGSKLINEGIRRLWAAQCKFIAVLGHPEYYPKFGFQTASDWSISHGFAGIPQEVFFVIGRTENSLNELRNGAFYYAEEFGPQHKNNST